MSLLSVFYSSFAALHELGLGPEESTGNGTASETCALEPRRGMHKYVMEGNPRTSTVLISFLCRQPLAKPLHNNLVFIARLMINNSKFPGFIIKLQDLIETVDRPSVQHLCCCMQLRSAPQTP